MALTVDGWAELETARLILQADREEFKAEQLMWEVTKFGSGGPTDLQLEASKGKLEAERSQLEKEKTQVMAAQCQLQTVISKLEVAKNQLEESRDQLETARRHLEAAKTQTVINNTWLEAAKCNLEAAKKRFEIATRHMDDAKSKFEDAKTQLEAATSSGGCVGNGTSSAHLVEENAILRNQLSDLLRKVNERKLIFENELKESHAEVQRLVAENSQLKAANRIDTKSLENENKTLPVENKSLEETVTSLESVNPKVFLDISIRGASAGRIVFELFADTTPRAAENFRALCTGEKGRSEFGTLLHYKGVPFNIVDPGCYISGGVLARGTLRSYAGESIYGVNNMPAENFTRKHTGPGDLSMGGRGQTEAHGSCFLISTTKNTYMDGAHVVIGKIVEGIDVLNGIVRAFHKTEVLPEGVLVIEDCGQL